jgi:hypothetical protein
MADTTIDILLNLQAKPNATKGLIDEFKKLEVEAAKLQKTLAGTIGMEGKNGQNTKRLQAALQDVKGKMAAINAEARKQELAKSLAIASKRANELRERMEKLGQVGRRMAMVGGLMLAPFILAMKKYVDATQETEPTSKRLVELGKQWEQTQIRIGRVTAEVVLPILEKMIPVVEKMVAFAEENPGIIKAAIGIGGTLVVLGGMLSTAASIVQTIATIQGLAAAVGIGGGGVAAAGGGGITAILAGLGPVLLAVLTNPLTWAVAALVLTVPIMNWLLGTNQTWADIAETGHKALIIIGYYIDKAIRGIGQFIVNLGTSLWNGIKSLGEWIVNAIKSIVSFLPGNSGTASAPVSSNSLGGNSATRAAERTLGGQNKTTNTNNKTISYHDYRRIDSKLSSNDRRLIVNDTMRALAGAL